MALNQKKKAFADAKLSGKSNRDAAIAAGLSEKTASQAGSRLAKDPDVLAYMVRMGYVPDADNAERLNVSKKAKGGGKVEDEPDAEKPRAPTPEERAAIWAAIGIERMNKPDPDKGDAPHVDRIAGDRLSKIQNLLDDILFGYTLATSEQIKVGIALLNAEIRRELSVGKKDAAKENAKKAASKFGRPPPGPRLAANGGKQV